MISSACSGFCNGIPFWGFFPEGNFPGLKEKKGKPTELLSPRPGPDAMARNRGTLTFLLSLVKFFTGQQPLVLVFRGGTQQLSPQSRWAQVGKLLSHWPCHLQRRAAFSSVQVMQTRLQATCSSAGPGSKLCQLWAAVAFSSPACTPTPPTGLAAPRQRAFLGERMSFPHKRLAALRAFQGFSLVEGNRFLEVRKQEKTSLGEKRHLYSRAPGLL